MMKASLCWILPLVFSSCSFSHVLCRPPLQMRASHLRGAWWQHVLPLWRHRIRRKWTNWNEWPWCNWPEKRSFGPFCWLLQWSACLLDLWGFYDVDKILCQSWMMIMFRDCKTFMVLQGGCHGRQDSNTVVIDIICNATVWCCIQSWSTYHGMNILLFKTWGWS